MVNCLQCGIGVLMASLSHHIADVHECDVPQAKVKRFSVPVMSNKCLLQCFEIHARSIGNSTDLCADRDKEQ